MDPTAARSANMAMDDAGSDFEAVPTTQLDFETAMNDFHKMFPDLELDVIEVVLRANQGAVDATIDQLLLMTQDNEREKSKQHSSTKTSSGASTSSGGFPESEPFKKPSSQSAATLQTYGTPLCIAKGWNSVLVGALPPDFLRLERRFSSHKEFELPDDITLLLQSHPEFMEVLRRDPEFMETLNREQNADHTKADSTEAEFKNRLARMGRISRRKLSQLARTFFRGTKAFPARHFSTFNERSILCDEDDDRTAVQPSKSHQESGLKGKE